MTTIILGAVVAMGVGVLAYLAWRYALLPRGVLTPTRESLPRSEEYKAVWIRNGVHPLSEGQVLVHLRSLPDLLKLAGQLQRPVVFGPNGHGDMYCVVDTRGSLHYVYMDEE
jgi:hypothetical protein